MTVFDNKNQGCFWTLIGGTIFLLLKTTILMLFWTWFVSPVFGIQEITFLQSMGLMFIVDFFRFKKDKKEDTPIWLYVFDVTVNLLLLLSFGFILHLVLC